MRSTNIPYVKEGDEEAGSQKRSQVTAFENPGYDSAGGLGEVYDDVVPVRFAPFEEVAEAGAVSNPVYTEIGMKEISSSQSVNAESDSGGPDVPKATSSWKTFQDEVAGELPKKEPLAKEKEIEEKAEYMTIPLKKEAEAQEEPRYASTMSTKTEEADSEQVKIEDLFVTIIGDEQEDTGVSGEKENPNAESES